MPAPDGWCVVVVDLAPRAALPGSAHAWIQTVTASRKEACAFARRRSEWTEADWARDTGAVVTPPDALYDSRCARCEAGEPHTWQQHEQSIVAAEVGS